MKDEIRVLVNDEMATQAAAQWQAVDAPQLLDDVSNMVYEFNSPDGRRILRLTHSSHHTRDEIEAELDWVNFLTRHGVPACKPLVSRHGHLTEPYPTGESYFTAAAFAYAPGRFVDWLSPADWDPSLMREFGRIMGRMHRLTRDYQPASPQQVRPQWTEEEELRHPRAILPADQLDAAGELEALLAHFNGMTPTAEDYGLVHGDMNPTNFHVQDGKLGLFDFDDCAYNWFINDIAIALPRYSKLFTQGDWEEKMTTFFRVFMDGYGQENHLEARWLDELPACLRLQNILDLGACHLSNIPNSQYHWFYELVLKTFREGHPLFDFDFRKAYGVGSD